MCEYSETGREALHTKTHTYTHIHTHTHTHTHTHSDIYIAVNDDIGLKRRGTKGRVELKVNTFKHTHTHTTHTHTHTTPRSLSLLHTHTYTQVRTDIVKEGGIKGIEHWRKYKIGKGLPEEETLVQLSQILLTHGLIDDHVTSLLAAEDGSKCIHTYTHTYIHSYSHTLSHSHIHTYTHTHTHTHTHRQERGGGQAACRESLRRARCTYRGMPRGSRK